MAHLAAKPDFASLKAAADKIDRDKQINAPADLSKPINEVDNDFLKTAVHDKLVTEVDTIDTSGFASNTQYNTGKSGLEIKIS